MSAGHPEASTRRRRASVRRRRKALTVGASPPLRNRANAHGPAVRAAESSLRARTCCEAGESTAL